MKNTWLLDIEVYPNFFFCGIKDYKNKNEFSFEISPYKDERKQLYQILSKYDGYLVTFNGISYDTTILAYFLKNFTKLSKLSTLEFCKKIKEFSNSTIADDFETIKSYRWFKKPWTDLDLYMFWSKLLRVNKQLSLKALAIQLDWDEIQELPYEHTTILSKEEIEVVKRYNLRNDLGVLQKLFEEMKEDITLRHYIKSEYGLECWSMDAPKICSEYLLDDYCKKTYSGNIPFEEYKREIRRKRYEPKSWKIGEYLPEANFKTDYFKALHEEFKEGDTTFYKTLPFVENDTSVILLPSVGGIHSVNDSQIWKSYTDEQGRKWFIIDADIASLYPTLLDEYKLIRPELTIVLKKYLDLKGDRIQAKREGLKLKDKFLKLCLNGITGMMDQDVNWTYSPEHITALRVLGQLIQLRFIENLTMVDGIKVFFTNTDGTCCMVREDRVDYYHKVAKAIEKEFRVTWEFTKNSKMVFANTNAYLSVIEEKYMLDDDANIIDHKVKREIKRKGFFKITHDEKGNREIPLGDSINEIVISRALQLYFVEGVPLEESIRNPWKYGFHIYDYCKSNKINKTYEVFYNGEKVQNLNRYYFSSQKPYLLKRKKGKDRFDHINVGEGVILFNKFEEKKWEDYDINFSHYTAKARKIVDEIEKTEKQMTLF